MKKPYLILSAGIIFLISGAAAVMSPTGKAGATGSPNETTCNTSQCHNSFALNSGPGSIEVTSDIPNWEYTPGQQYTINVKVAHAGRALFGFGTEILKADGANSGTLAVINATKTQLLNISIAGKLRKNVTHKSNGGASQDSAVFSFHWTAPAAGTGNATIYFAGNACNNNNSAAGDYVYSGTQVITEGIATGIHSEALEALNVFPNPVKDVMNISYTLQQEKPVSIKIYSMDGKLIREINRPVQSGEQNISIATDNSFSRGTYVLKIEAGTYSSAQKIFVQ